MKANRNFRLLLRPEHNQWNFVASAKAAYDGAIVNAKYLTPHPTGSHAALSPVRLAASVRRAERDLIIDPNTPGLVSRSVQHSSAARLRATPAAQAVRLPLTVEQLRVRSIRDAFVDACLEGQVPANLKAPPYLDFQKVKADAFDVNLLMIERTLQIVGPSRAIAFIQITLAKLREGELLNAVGPLAATGLKHVILRIRDLGEKASGEDLKCLLDALDAFSAQGLELTVDCAGRVGPVLVQQGAMAFSTGPMHFRKVAQPLLATGGGGGGSALRYESYGAWEWIDRGEIGNGLACPVAGCKAVAGCELDDIREHNLHLLRHIAQEATNWTTVELVTALRKSGSPVAASWANTLINRVGGSAAEEASS